MTDRPEPASSRTVLLRGRDWVAGLPPLAASAVGALVGLVLLLAVVVLLPEPGAGGRQPVDAADKGKRAGPAAVSEQRGPTTASRGGPGRAAKDTERPEREAEPTGADRDAAARDDGERPDTAAATGAPDPSPSASPAPSATASPLAVDPTPSPSAEVEAVEEPLEADPGR